MAYKHIGIDELRVNRANDRHGEVESEPLAFAELFRLHDLQMRNLATDIAQSARVYDPPLVMPEGGAFTVFDGNRRVTCLKLLLDPKRAPSRELQQFFTNLGSQAPVPLPKELTCQVEDDRNLIDNILYRRHTGSRRGVGQLDWNDRAKLNFVERTGQGSGINVAAEVERFLAEDGRLPTGNIPWSTLTRLLSSEEFRNRVGISTAGRKFQITHDRQAVTDSLNRIASDLASQKVTLGNLWNNEGKRAYLNRLQDEGVLPVEIEKLPAAIDPADTPHSTARKSVVRAKPLQTTFISADAPHIQWLASQQRARAIWDELRGLEFRDNPNAISALMRILVELAVGGYVSEHNLKTQDTLSHKVGAVSAHLLKRQIIDRPYWDELERLRRDDQLISVASMQRLIHSPDFAPMESELRAYWTRLGRFLIAALSR